MLIRMVRGALHAFRTGVEFQHDGVSNNDLVAIQIGDFEYDLIEASFQQHSLILEFIPKRSALHINTRMAAAGLILHCCIAAGFRSTTP